MPVRAAPVPSEALLTGGTEAQDYTDAFTVDVPGDIALADLIRCFYTTWLFRAEGVVLSVVGRGPKRSDLDALAIGSGARFAAWTVIERTETEIFLTDVTGHTRSWLATEPLEGGTRLWFGSAVLATSQQHGEMRLSLPMKALLPLHRVYSWGLLTCAARRVRQI